MKICHVNSNTHISTQRAEYPKQLDASDQASERLQVHLSQKYEMI